MEFDNITVIPNEQKDPDGKYTEKIIGYFKNGDVMQLSEKLAENLPLLLYSEGTVRFSGPRATRQR